MTAFHAWNKVKKGVICFLHFISALPLLTVWLHVLFSVKKVSVPDVQWGWGQRYVQDTQVLQLQTVSWWIYPSAQLRCHAETLCGLLISSEGELYCNSTAYKNFLYHCVESLWRRSTSGRDGWVSTNIWPYSVIKKLPGFTWRQLLSRSCGISVLL